MGKQIWRPGNMLYPLPAVLVTTRSADGKDNICTVAWTGTVCSDPAMVSISLRKSRLSYTYLNETGVFAINLTTVSLLRATDFCGVRSGRELDKFEAMHLTKLPASRIECCVVGEAPVSIECSVKQKMDLGSHTIFLAEVVSVLADEQYMDENGRFSLEKAQPIVYSHGRYCAVGKQLGSFGFSVKKPGKPKKRH